MEYNQKTKKKQKRKGKKRYDSSSSEEELQQSSTIKKENNVNGDDIVVEVNEKEVETKVKIEDDVKIKEEKEKEEIIPKKEVHVKAFLYFLEPNITPLFTDFFGKSIDHLAEVTKMTEHCVMVNFIVPEIETFTFKIRVLKKSYGFTSLFSSSSSYSFENEFRQRDIKGVEGECLYDIVFERFDNTTGHNAVLKLHSNFHYFQAIRSLSSVIPIKDGISLYDEATLKFFKLLKKHQNPYDKIIVKLEEIIEGSLSFYFIHLINFSYFIQFYNMQLRKL